VRIPATFVASGFCLAINMTLPKDYVIDLTMLRRRLEPVQGTVFCALLLT
jgi:hypothetical protein